MQEVDLVGGEGEGLDGVQQPAGARNDAEAARSWKPAAEELEDTASRGGPRLQRTLKHGELIHVSQK